MPILIHAIRTSLEEEPSAAIAKAVKLLGVSEREVVSACISKTSLDARACRGTGRSGRRTSRWRYREVPDRWITGR